MTAECTGRTTLEFALGERPTLIMHPLVWLLSLNLLEGVYKLIKLCYHPGIIQEDEHEHNCED